ncbi:DUF427 domain-containing protein [Halioglobus maricola]|uniref:DUF427 domain-containing protein n=1 Tax=Halioglobus maricola TaxID=2601894 RepID=A0A5P9NLY9_9GAMM|nr:DUF427 domain-containing protein [Halioglobus maricola]QFU76772.1 DUF427 domain-containing protein [Halioglobus maricola]
MWQYTGKQRPPFADEPGPDQESVWDYPRPPALVPCDALVEVFDVSLLLASTTCSLRILETASPPTFYLPPDAVDWSQLVEVQGSSFCEWKGAATYWSLANDPGGPMVGWSYEQPSSSFAAIMGYTSFYPRLLKCHVDGERVQPQPGGFYGGWITSKVAGPFKGEPGTGHW